MYVCMFARNTSIIFQFYFKNLSQISSAYCGKMGDPSNISNKSHKIMKKSSKKHTKKRTKAAKKLFDCNQTQKQTLISGTLKLCMYLYIPTQIEPYTLNAIEERRLFLSSFLLILYLFSFLRVFNFFFRFRQNISRVIYACAMELHVAAVFRGNSVWHADAPNCRLERND